MQQFLYFTSRSGNSVFSARNKMCDICDFWFKLNSQFDQYDENQIVNLKTLDGKSRRTASMMLGGETLVNTDVKM